MLITVALQGDRPLLGPRPAEVFDPVPRADLVRAMVDGLNALLDRLPTDTRNVLLTLARIQCTLATGEIRSKDRAAEWVIERLPRHDRAVLARARAIYLGVEEERLGRPEANSSSNSRLDGRRDPTRSVDWMTASFTYREMGQKEA